MLDLVIFGTFSAVLFALAPILQKKVLRTGQCSVATMVAVGGMLSMIVGIVYVLVNGRKVFTEVTKLDTSSLVLIAVAGISGGFLANFLFLMLLHRYDAYLVNTFMYLSPVMTLLLAYLILEETMTWTSLVGVAFVIGGVLIIVSSARLQKEK